MKHLLLVDDDPSVLSGIRRSLYRHRQEWHLDVCDNALLALSTLDIGRYDVIISDMRMPGMDGADFLAQVRQRHPGVVRVVLSAHAGTDASLRASHCAHQALSKPCDSGKLEAKLKDIFWLGELIRDEAVRDLVGGIDHLGGTGPALFAKVRNALSDPHVRLADIGELVETDIAAATKILQLVNSSFFGLGRAIVNVGQAVAYLGASVLEALVLSAELSTTAGPAYEHLQARAEARAARARQIAAADLRDQAFTAALLADVGEAFIPGSDDHPRVGAYLLGIWGLPLAVVHAVAHHHTPCGCALCTTLATATANIAEDMSA